MVGGYDEGYLKCPCFWGKDPGSLVRRLSEITPQTFPKVLDAGCGEGKNAAYYAERGSQVMAVDISEVAISHGRRMWPDLPIKWEVADVRSMLFDKEGFDLVIAYGLLHCLSSRAEVASVLSTLLESAKKGGYLLMCAFNSRKQDLTAHSGFNPILLSHEELVGMFRSCDILYEDDSDLVETHPHNEIEHTHSLTRVIARITDG